MRQKGWIAVAATTILAASLGVGASRDAHADVSPSPPAAPSGTDGAAAPVPAPADVAIEAPPETGVTAVEVAGSGNVRKDLGEPAGLTVAGSDRSYFEIVVESVTVTTACPGRGVDVAPLHGYFVVVDVTATMSEDVLAVAGGLADPFMPLVSDAFHVIGPDGTVRTDTLTEASWGCFAESDLAPPFVGAGESASGLVVLDTPYDRGSLVYAPRGLGWEWSFGG